MRRARGRGQVVMSTAVQSQSSIDLRAPGSHARMPRNLRLRHVGPGDSAFLHGAGTRQCIHRTRRAGHRALCGSCRTRVTEEKHCASGRRVAPREPPLASCRGSMILSFVILSFVIMFEQQHKFAIIILTYLCLIYFYQLAT